MKNEGMISKYKVLEILYESYGLRDAEKRIAELPTVSTEKKNVEIVKFDTPYTDAISRQAAIDAMREETCLSCWDAKDILEHLPSISTEKTGRWIFDERIDKHYYCSECKAMGADYFDYCPYCGAKIVEPQESEE